MFLRTISPARRVAERITGDRAVSEELAAEALTRAYLRWRRLRRSGYVDAWVMRVTANLAIDAVRKRPSVAAVPGPAADPAEMAVLRGALVDALRRLPQKQREAVVLRYLADLREDEVASALGVAAGTVKTHLHRGVEALRNQLGNDPTEELTHDV